MQDYKSKPKPKTITISSLVKIICKNSKNVKDDELKSLDDIKEKYPEIIKLNDLVEAFKNLFKDSKKSLQHWINKAKVMNIAEINSFITGLERDRNSVENSFKSIYNNCLLEGMVNKVKGIKRSSYGRCRFDLLRLKILHSQEIYS